ncbi:hypothetical protein K6119_08505 [Paracrocinitomix mangrovi]|uniref:hypothetical protein n=1 Tax=Paracrocinitomix mangrovi TaxID=2862509 RepID=UPI001C8EE9B8|nr:hypothetical protein [Paracrocinitomix mangrovi]UKN03554.1 hypothetical protein K6119_08505 [Paracrocinitomix mangrovi]
MKLARFYSEGELSSIQISNEEEAVSEIKNLFFGEQLEEEQIMLEIYAQNKGLISDVDELRLDFDRIFSKKQLVKKGFLSAKKLVDSSNYNQDFSIQTILSIKSEQTYLNANFRGFMILLPRHKWLAKETEPMLFAKLKNDNFYWVNADQSKSQPNSLHKFWNWIQKKISFKTSSK